MNIKTVYQLKKAFSDNKTKEGMNQILKEIIKMFYIEDEGRILKEEDVENLSENKKIELLKLFFDEVRQRLEI